MTTVQTTPDVTFKDLGLDDLLLRALADEKHHTPTPIQAAAIPVVLSGRDLIGIAQTGTGKTGAFALPILNHIIANPRRAERRAARVLVLSPTRELSGQILESFRTYGRHVRPTSALAIGGVPLGRQARAIAPGVDVLVATPGRLVDLLGNDAVRLDQVEVFVLDEADQMLDMGFIHAIRSIVARLPKERRNLFFSATMPKAIEDLASHLLVNPARVQVTPVAKTADRVDQHVIFTDRAGKPNLLAEVLKRDGVERTLVFTRTKHGADRVVQGLAKAGIDSAAIHGNKSQSQRERALASFREGKTTVLVATDIAARGIDVPGVSHVVNYDLPNVPESYVHRIGRTARAGRDGIAISFCDGEERAYLRDIERLIRISIPSTDRRGETRGVSARPESDAPRRDPRPNGGRPEGARNNAPRNARPAGDHRNNDRNPRGERPAAGERSGDLNGVRFMQPSRKDGARDGDNRGARRPAR